MLELFLSTTTLYYIIELKQFRVTSSKFYLWPVYHASPLFVWFCEYRVATLFNGCDAQLLQPSRNRCLWPFHL